MEDHCLLLCSLLLGFGLDAYVCIGTVSVPGKELIYLGQQRATFVGNDFIRGQCNILGYQNRKKVGYLNVF